MEGCILVADIETTSLFDELNVYKNRGVICVIRRNWTIYIQFCFFLMDILFWLPTLPQRPPNCLITPNTASYFIYCIILGHFTPGSPWLDGMLRLLRVEDEDDKDMEEEEEGEEP